MNTVRYARAIVIAAAGGLTGWCISQSWEGPVNWGENSNPTNVMPAHFLMLPSGNALILPTGASNGTRAWLIKRIGASDWSYQNDRVWVGFADDDYFSGGHFCGGQMLLDDASGSLLIVGGDDPGNAQEGRDHAGIKAVSLFKESGGSGTWNHLASTYFMNYARYYPTLLGTPDGRAVAFGGWDEMGERVLNHEVLTLGPNSTGWPTPTPWQAFPANNPDYALLYAHMYVMPDGRYFNAGPHDEEYDESRVYSPWSLSWATYGEAPTSDYGVKRTYPSSCMIVALDSNLENTKAYVARSGGVDRMDKLGDTIYYATDKAQVLELTGSNPTWNIIPFMNQRRCNHQMIALPNRQILAINGNEYGKFNELVGGQPDGEGFRKPEIFDFNAWYSNHSNGGWTSYDPPPSLFQYTRGYHSTAWLMPDGRVGVGGGEPGTQGDAYKAQFWSPPYLSVSNRPVISTMPTGALRYGTTFQPQVSIHTGRSIARMCLIALPEVTHAFAQNNRYVDLKWTVDGSGGIHVEMPENANFAPPGWYMYFVVDSAGAVSVARIVRVSDEFSHCVPNDDKVFLNGSSTAVEDGHKKLRSGDNWNVAFSYNSSNSNEVEVWATVTDLDPTDIRLRIEHKAPLLGATCKGYLWNYTTSSWDWVMPGVSVTAYDQLTVQIVSGPGDLADYVDDTTKVMKAKLKYENASAGTTITIDEVQIGTRT